MKALLLVVLTVLTAATVAAAEELPPLPAEVAEVIQQKGILLGIHEEKFLRNIGIPAVVLYWAAEKTYALTVLMGKNDEGEYGFPEANAQTIIRVVWVEGGPKKGWINKPLLKKIILDLLTPPSKGLEKEDIKYDI